MNTNKILVADVGGQPHHWARWQDGVTLKFKGLLSYEIGDASVFHGGTSHKTGERSQVQVGQIVFLKESLKYDARVPPLTNDNLFQRDLNICAYCTRRYSKEKLSRDHILATTNNGKNIWMNVVTSCKPCNHMKADLMLGVARDEDGDLMELAYLPYVPSHVERLILANKNILADQMDFLKAMLPKNSRILQANNILGLELHEDKTNVKRHFYSAKEMSEIKHKQEVLNSRHKRS